MKRSRYTGEQGFTLIELLLVSSLFLVVLTATTAAFTSFERLNRDDKRLNDQTSQARRGIDRGSRQLRNLARRVDVPTINRAEPYDFIFQTSDPTKTWVRMCAQARPDGRTFLWALASGSATVTSSMRSACPGTGWARQDPFVQNLTNTAGGRSVPAFTFTCVQSAPAGCPNPATAADLGRVQSVGMDVLLDNDPTRKPVEARVTSAVFLRNQNEPPTAAFTATPVSSRQVLLNGSASSDPEGRTLRYLWFLAPAPVFRCDQPVPAATDFFQGVTVNYTFASGAGNSGQQRLMELVVCDPGDLQARYSAQVTIP